MDSPYLVAWVEIRANKGIVTRADQSKIDAILKFYPYKKSKAIYKHFNNKSEAIEWLSSFNKKLDKRYECRIFTDAQFAISEVIKENGNREMIVPFTAKQKNEIYYI